MRAAGGASSRRDYGVWVFPDIVGQRPGPQAAALLQRALRRPRAVGRRSRRRATRLHRPLGRPPGAGVSSPDLVRAARHPARRRRPVFRAPWEAQAFAMAVVLHERGVLHLDGVGAAAGRRDRRRHARGEADDGRRYYQLLAGRAREARRRQASSSWPTSCAPATTRGTRPPWSTPHGQPIVLPGR